MGKRTMSLREACELVPDDLPDGAYWAMAHELAGADYGEVQHELADDFDGPLKEPQGQPRGSTCNVCGKPFERKAYMRQHRAAKHPEFQPQQGKKQ
jgi:hypothetical protein